MNDLPDQPSAKQQQVSDVLHRLLEPILLPIAMKVVAALGTKEGERAIEQLHSQSVVTVHVLDSTFRDGQHTAYFKVSNGSNHGVYLESIKLIAPEGEYEVKHIDDAPGIPTPDTKRGWRRSLIPSGEYYLFAVTFPQAQDPTYLGQWAGRLEMEISQLDQTKPETRDVPFRVRWQ